MGARADTASEAEVNAFYEWAGELYPAKSLVTTMAHGRLPLEVLDVVCGPTAPAPRSSHRDEAAAAAEGAAAGPLPLGPAPIPTSVAPGRPHRVLGGTDEFKTCGWVFSREDVFVRPKVGRCSLTPA